MTVLVCARYLRYARHILPFTNRSDVVKCYLMYCIPVPCPFLGLLGFGDFGMATLSYQRGERGKHFTASCPKISIVLDHAQETTEVFD